MLASLKERAKVGTTRLSINLLILFSMADEQCWIFDRPVLSDSSRKAEWGWPCLGFTIVLRLAARQTIQQLDAFFHFRWFRNMNMIPSCYSWTIILKTSFPGHNSSSTVNEGTLDCYYCNNLSYHSTHIISCTSRTQKTKRREDARCVRPRIS
jgi:hypothetical protein